MQTVRYDLPLSHILNWAEFAVLYQGDFRSCRGVLSHVLAIPPQRYEQLRANLLRVQPFFTWTEGTEYGDAFWMTMLTLRHMKRLLGEGRPNEWR